MARDTPDSSAEARAEAAPSRRRLIRGVLALMAGTTAAQAVSLLLSPVLTRLFGPEAFGLLGVFMSLAAVAASISTLRYEMAVVLPDGDRDGAAVAALSLGVSALFAAFVLPVVVVFGDPLAREIQAGDASRWLWLIPLVILAEAITRTLRYWGTRRAWYGQVASLAVLQVAATLVVSLSIGAWGVAPLGGLVVGYTAGAAVVGIGWCVTAMRRDGTLFRSGAWRSRVVPVAREFQRLPRYALPSGLLNAVSIAVLPILLARAFGLEVAGFVLLVTRVLQRPVEILVQSLWQVVHSRLAALARDAQRRLVVESHQIVAAALALPLAGVCAFAPFLDELFGADWTALPPFVAPLTVMVFANAVSNASSYFAAFRRFRAEAATNIVLGTVRVLAVAVGVAGADPVAAVWWYAGVSAAFYVGLNLWWSRQLDRTAVMVRNVAVPTVLAVGVGGATAWVLADHGLVMAGGVYLLGGGVYAAVCVPRELVVRYLRRGDAPHPIDERPADEDPE